MAARLRSWTPEEARRRRAPSTRSAAPPWWSCCAASSTRTRRRPAGSSTSAACIRRHINVFVNGERGREETAVGSRRPRRGAARDHRRSEHDRAAAGDQEGAVRARGRARMPGSRSTRRAFAGEPVDFATARSRAAGALIATVDLAVLRAEDLVRRRHPARRVDAGRGRRAARGRRAGARADLGDRPRRGRHAVRRRRPRRAVREPRRRRDLGAQRARCGSTGSTQDWQPGGGGLCLHSIVPWPGEPDGWRSPSRPPACG